MAGPEEQRQMHERLSADGCHGNLWRFQATPSQRGGGHYSPFKGVHRTPQLRSWYAVWKGKRYLGAYLAEEDAAMAYDAKAREHGLSGSDLNFPERSVTLEELQLRRETHSAARTIPQELLQTRRYQRTKIGKAPSSNFVGVQAGKGKWSATFHYRAAGARKSLHLGCFFTERQAALAWDFEARSRGRSTYTQHSGRDRDVQRNSGVARGATGCDRRMLHLLRGADRCCGPDSVQSPLLRAMSESSPGERKLVPSVPARCFGWGLLQCHRYPRTTGPPQGKAGGADLRRDWKGAGRIPIAD